MRVNALIDTGAILALLDKRIVGTMSARRIPAF
jgi:hypothetical protein